MDGCEDATKQSAADGHLGKLERDGTGMADDPCADFDHLDLEAGQTSTRYRLGPTNAAKEGRSVLLREPRARFQSGPFALSRGMRHIELEGPLSGNCPNFAKLAFCA